MTNFFQYADLTWPEVAQLPRTTPLVLPLGGGYSLDTLANALGDPERIGLLPEIPFGWTGSSLPVAEPVFENLVQNLLGSIRDDGFTQVFVLAPQGVFRSQVYPSMINRELISQPHPSRNAPANFLPPDDQQEKVILISVGHTEQHAYHLPLSTDTLIIEAIAQGAALAAPTRAYALPVFPYGVSTHRASFAGTLNCGGRPFEDFWLDVLDRLVSRNFRRIYLLSGHGGNCSFFTNVVKYAGERYPVAFIATAWLYLSGPAGVTALQTRRNSAIGGMGHACELETSLILHLRPDLVHMDRVVDDTSFISTLSYYMDWVEGGALIANPPWEDDSTSGAYGAGSLGDPDKGSYWLQAAIEEKCAHIEEIHEQFERRRKSRLQ